MKKIKIRHALFASHHQIKKNSGASKPLHGIRRQLQRGGRCIEPAVVPTRST
jgi:hypothetical protein